MKLLPLLAWLACAGPALSLEIRNIQACHGPLGPARTRLEVTPLEEVVYRFVVAGLKPAANGEFQFDIAYSMTDSTGKVVLSDTGRHSVVAVMSGDATPATAAIQVGPTAPPGDYTLRVTVTDCNGGGDAHFSRRLTCKPGEFRAINPRFFHDAARTTPGPAGGLAGQSIYLRVLAAGPKWEAGKSSVALRVELTDLEGNTVSRQPVTTRREITEGGPFRGIGLETLLPLAKPGEYQIKLTVIDELARREDVITLPLTVGSP
ncbi:MAG: hypothetical protein K1X57_07605 [Gemmataceae bacterium]|nr:hypothetical protein [Gemmataceae bacterium]